MATLYEVHNELVEVEQAAESDDPQQFQDAANRMLEVQAKVEDKLGRYVKVIREFEERAAARDREARRLRDAAVADNNIAQGLKDKLSEFLAQHEMKRVRTDVGTVTRAKNGGKQPVEVLVGEDQLPEEYARVIYDVKPDTDAMREALQSGQDLPFARLQERGHHVRIK